MKRLTLILVGLAMSVSMMAQNSIINKYFEKYADNEKFTKVTINQKMFSLFANFEGNTEEETEFMQAISKLEGLKILVGDSIDNSMGLYNKVVAELDKAPYEELMSVKDGDENVKFSIVEKDGIVKEMIMVVGEKNEFVLLSLYGEIDLKNVSKIASGMNMQGMKNLSNFHYENHDKEDHHQDED
ncbi:MAG: hypothetical protein C0598_12400 [Marinilabiliales bacterium]|nr:MAG: hypothetical protein C0598_12400 [Marinilabiliales bacterium]